MRKGLESRDVALRWVETETVVQLVRCSLVVLSTLTVLACGDAQTTRPSLSRPRPSLTGTYQGTYTVTGCTSVLFPCPSVYASNPVRAMQLVLTQTDDRVIGMFAGELAL